MLQLILLFRSPSRKIQSKLKPVTLCSNSASAPFLLCFQTVSALEVIRLLRRARARSESLVLALASSRLL